MKNKQSFRERLKQAKKSVKNPFKAIATRDLLITLLSLLICVSSGFCFGYSCAKSCKPMTASADASLEALNSTPVKPNQGLSNGAYQYVFTNHLDWGLHVFDFVVYRSYTPTYLIGSHWIAQADDNSYSPAEYVKQQLYSLTSEEEYFGLEVSSSMLDEEVELHYCWWDEEEGIFSYYEEIMTYYCSVVSYSNLEEGGFTGNLKYLITTELGFAIVLENGSYYGVCFSRLAGRSSWFSFLVNEGIGTIYTYQDIFADNSTDAIYLQGFDNGYSAGYTEGYSYGLVDGAANEYPIAYQEGYEQGYDDGYIVGVDVSLDDVTPWDSIVSAVNKFLQIEVIPNITFSVIFQLTFGLLLLGFAIKIFLGG